MFMPWTYLTNPTLLTGKLTVSELPSNCGHFDQPFMEALKGILSSSSNIYVSRSRKNILNGSSFRAILFLLETSNLCPQNLFRHLQRHI
jgi:hypothetical protein